MVATICLGDPEFTLVALFEAASSYISEELSIGFSHCIMDFIFFASLTLMKGVLAFQAVVLRTFWTFEFFVFVIENENVFAIGSQTICHVLVGFCVVFECSLVKQVHHFIRQ